MLRKALEIYEALDKQDGIADVCVNMGRIRRDRGQIQDARQFWTRARDIYASIEMPRDAARLQTWVDELAPGSNE